MNRVTLFGNVGRDPEIRSITSGERIANLSLATTEKWTDKGSGERKEATEWHRIVAFGAIVDTIEKYVHKGSKLLVEGSVRTRKWVDQSGTERYTTEIRMTSMEFAGSADRNDAGGDEQQEQPRQRQRATAAAAPDRKPPIDDDIPF